jgi:hypothetical protein
MTTVTTFRNEGNDVADWTLRTGLVSQPQAKQLVAPHLLGLWQPTIYVAPAITNPTTGTQENVLATYVIPGGLMGPNGAMRWNMLWSVVNNTNAKNVRIRINNNPVQAVNMNSGTGLSGWLALFMQNKNDEKAQIAPPAGAVSPSNLYGVALASWAIDTSQPMTVTITAQAQTSATDLIRFEALQLDTLYSK